VFRCGDCNKIIFQEGFSDEKIIKLATKQNLEITYARKKI